MSYASLSPSIPKRRLYSFTSASRDRSFVTVWGSHFICIITLIRIDIDDGISFVQQYFTSRKHFHVGTVNFTRLLGRGGPLACATDEGRGLFASKLSV